MKTFLFLGLCAMAAVAAMLLGATPANAGSSLILAAVIIASYKTEMDEAVAGMIASEVNWDGSTYILEDATAGFGLAVGLGTEEKQCSLGGALDTFIGVTMKDITLIPGAIHTEVDKYAQYDNVGVLQMGEIWVQTTGAAPTKNDPVHYNATTGVFGVSGGSGPVLGARWVKTGSNNLARLRLPAYGQAT